ncbi:MAG: hypothetical protein WCS09_02795 [Pseudomonadota bacterium]
MSALIERLRAGRETWTTFEAWQFRVRRPTFYQLAQITRHDDDAAVVRVAVVGWKGMREQDLVAGGTADEAPFDIEVFLEWAQDRPDLWNHLLGEIGRLVSEHRIRIQAAEKN